MQKRKGVSTRINSSNYSLIEYSYLNYDPSQVESIFMKIQLKNKVYHKDQIIGYVKVKENQQNNQQKKQQQTINQIHMRDTGIITKIGSKFNIHQREGQEFYLLKQSTPKTSSLNLFDLQLCQHIPQLKIVNEAIQQKKQQKDTKTVDKKTRKKQRPQPLQCVNCQQKIHYFYLFEQIQVKYSQIQNQFQLDQIQQIQKIQWTVNIGQHFTGNTQIAKYQQKQFKLNQGGKITYLVNWSTLQSVKSNLVILKYRQLVCQHQKIQNNVCQYCLQEVDPVQLSLKKYLFQMQQKDNFKRNMITTGNALAQQQNQFVQNILAKQKCIIILDLDNTILHAIQLNQINQERLNQVQQYYHLLVGKQTHFNIFIGSTFIVKMRPYFKQFIQTVLKYYEVFIYTKGTRKYAQQICNAIRNQYESTDHPTSNINKNLKYYDFLKDKKAFVHSRIITRDQDPNLQKKSLDNILPTRQQSVMVMDDLGKVWGYSYSVLYTIPYNFFYKRRQIKEYEQRRIKIRQSNIQIIEQNSTHQQTLQKIISQDKIYQLTEKVIQVFQPIKQLPCDHFQRQVNQIQQKQRKQIMNANNLVPNFNGPQLVDIKQTQIVQNKNFQSDILPRKDYYLIYAAHALKQIHKQFFEGRKNNYNDKHKPMPISIVHKTYKNKLLDGIKICFIMKNQHKIYVLTQAAKKLGCIVIDQSNKTQRPDYLIRLNNLSQNDPKKLENLRKNPQNNVLIKRKQIQIQAIKYIKNLTQSLKIPFVSQTWIDFCFVFTYGFSPQHFIIDNDKLNHHIDEQDYQWIIQSNAFKILKNLNQDQNQKINNNEI